MSIFSLATIISQHWLNSLGHGLPHRVATGIPFYSSTTTSWSRRRFHTLRSSTFCLTTPQRSSVGFRSGDMLGQWSSWRCVLALASSYLSSYRYSFWREGAGSCSAAPQCRQHSCTPGHDAPTTMPLVFGCRHTRLTSISWSHHTTGHRSSGVFTIAFFLFYIQYEPL